MEKRDVSWRVEVDEGDRWRQIGVDYSDRESALGLRIALRVNRPTWKDGSEIVYRVVRMETTIYVEEG